MHTLRMYFIKDIIPEEGVKPISSSVASDLISTSCTEGVWFTSQYTYPQMFLMILEFGQGVRSRHKSSNLLSHSAPRDCNKSKKNEGCG